MKIRKIIMALMVATLGSTSVIPIVADAEETGEVNHLSYPALLVGDGSVVSVIPRFDVPEGTFAVNYSYGCNVPQTININGTPFNYPNTTCAILDDTGLATEWLGKTNCTAYGAPCSGINSGSLDRIYWQKVTANDWSSQVTGINETLPLKVRNVDWGDSIEVVTWNENSVLRVETQPFADLSKDALPEIPPAPGETIATQLGYEMWHAEGQGINEKWGVRTQEDGDVKGSPYAYQSPYAIINAGTAKLYLSKLSPAGDDEMACPSPGGGEESAPATASFDGKLFTPGTGWSDSYNLEVVDYTVELSVSGKYVHGYNWRMRDLPETFTCGVTTWQKTGWWRLTFEPNGGSEKMVFSSDTAITPPIIPVAVPTDVSLLAESEDDGEDEVEETLYTPKIDPVKNLTYIDICIRSKDQGGGSGGQTGDTGGYKYGQSSDTGGKGKGGSSGHGKPDNTGGGSGKSH